MTLLNCPGCGSGVEDSMAYCPECGHALLLPTAMASSDESSNEPPDDGVARGLAEGRLRTCPDCSAVVSHRLAACPRCGCPFEGAGQAANSLWQDYEWDSPYRGIRLYRLGLITYAVSMLAEFVFVLFAAMAKSADLAVTLTIVSRPAIITANAIMLLGLYGFTSIPRESGSAGLAWAGFYGSLTATVGMTLSLLFALAGIMTSALPYFGVVVSIAWVVGSICFILALAGVARFVGAPDLGGRALSVLVLLLLTVGLNTAFDVLSGMSRRPTVVTTILLPIGLAIIVVIYLVKFLQLLATMTAIFGQGSFEEEELTS